MQTPPFRKDREDLEQLIRRAVANAPPAPTPLSDEGAKRGSMPFLVEQKYTLSLPHCERLAAANQVRKS
jgi:hypothetical protein